MRDWTIRRLPAALLACLLAFVPAFGQPLQDRSSRPGNSGGGPPGRPGGGQSGGNRPGSGGTARPQPSRPGSPGPGGSRPSPGQPNPGRPGPGHPSPGHPGPGRPQPQPPRPGTGGRPGNGPNRPGPGRPPSRPGNRPPQWGRPPQHRPSYHFRPNDRSYLRHYYRHRLSYINRARRPVFVVGGYFPFGDIGYLTPVPADIYGYLPPPPPGYQVGYFDGYVVVYDPLTYFIANVVDLLDS